MDLKTLSLFHFVSPMLACKFTYSLVFRMDCKLPVTRNSFQRWSVYVIISRHTQISQNERYHRIFLSTGNLISTLFYVTEFKSSFSLATSSQDCWWDLYSIFFSHLVLAPLSLMSRNDSLWNLPTGTLFSAPENKVACPRTNDTAYKIFQQELFSALENKATCPRIPRKPASWTKI